MGDLVVLQQEFANAGKSAEDIGPVFSKMAKSLQGGSADETIKKLGINLDELKKKTPAEQFRTLDFGCCLSASTSCRIDQRGRVGESRKSRCNA